MSKKIYRFGPNATDGNAEMADLLGGKGANLAEMANLGLPVPYGITIPTTTCLSYLSLDSDNDRLDFLSQLVDEHVKPALYDIVCEVGYPPLWSVRSGSKFSMPGMMDTLLNIGITDESRDFLINRLGECSAYDCERRLIAMYGETVHDLSPEPFKNDWVAKQSQKYGLKKAPGSAAAVLASPKHMKKAVEMHRKIFEKRAGKPFPDTLDEQLIGAIGAVFNSWNSDRAIEYREMHGIPHDLGTAVNIQMMVFGNMNDKSGSGVAFTRDPATGENVLMGEFLLNAQGEEVVAGTATPKPIAEMPNDWFGELNLYGCKLEDHYKDMLDLEFTVEDDKLWMLQCRVGKRTAEAAFRIAHDMVDEGLIDKADAINRVTAKQYLALKKVRIEGDTPEPDYEGIAAGGGLVTGHIVTDSEMAKLYGKEKPVILVTDETTPEDFGGMAASVGILTRTGGATSHAAVVGRSLEKSCVVGVTNLPPLGNGGAVTICGSTGQVWLKELSLTKGEAPDFAKTVFAWAVEINGVDVAIKQGVEDEIKPGSYVMLAGAKPAHIEQIILNTDDLDGKAFVDLTFPEENKLDDDKLLWGLLGGTNDDLDKMTMERVEAIATHTAVSNLVIVPNSHTTKQQTAALRSAGWKVCERVSTVEELLDSDGIVDVDPGFASSIGGDHVAQKLFQLMSDAGKMVECRPNPVSQSKLVFEVLK